MRIHRCTSSALIYKYRPHAHDTWEIVCQLEGETQTELDARRYVMHPGDVLLIPPNVVHKGISETGFRDLSLRADITLPREMVFYDQSGDVRALVSMIQRLVTERASGYEAVADSFAESVARLIAHRYGAAGSPAVEAVKRQIYEHLSDTEFSLAECIRATGFDSDHFRRVFKRETGKTPAQYQVDLRLRHAKELLSEQQHFSVESVAYSCGFSDALYFSTCFRKHVGTSPSEYRRRKGE